MKLCASFLLNFLHLKQWSPQTSCVLLQMQVGVSGSVNNGSRNFRLVAMRKLQFGSLLFLLLRDILMIGWDVWGDRMLGNRGRCSLAVW